MLHQSSMLRRFESRLSEVARHRKLSILLVGVLPLLLRAALLPWFGAPQPRVQDEFSHLLAADTLAHGRLVNPVHPMWAHFESMHILVRPVYASVFPVANGAVMAVAQVATGSPWIGVWIGIGCMCAALCWMLQGWVPPAWALLGAVLAAVRFGVLSYWMNSFYGGAVAALGGALVLGAVPRILRRRRWRDAVLFGVGVAILANSRPYEGAIFAVPVLLALLWQLWRTRRALAVLIPLVPVLGVTAVAMGIYNARFSGNPLLLPYSFYRTTTTLTPHFVWQEPRPEGVYLHRVLRDFYTHWEMSCYTAARENRSPYGISDKAIRYWRFYLGPVLSMALLTIPWLWRRKRTRWLLLFAAWICLALVVEVWHAPHYAAPAMGLVMLLTVFALRQVRRLAGPLAVRAVVAGSLLTPVIDGNSTPGQTGNRAPATRQLLSSGGQHLVLVRYRVTHDTGNEWVYNAADIDRAPIVWAREMDPASNRKLLAYFRGRQVWLAQPDLTPPALTPYDPSLPPDPPFRFVPFGTEPIDALRSPEEVRQTMLRLAPQTPEPPRLSCDHWDYIFTQATGVEAPDPAHGCFPSGDRGQLLAIDQWLSWLQTQR